MLLKMRLKDFLVLMERNINICAPRVSNTERPRFSSPFPYRVAATWSKVSNDAVNHLLSLKRWVLGNGCGITGPQLAPTGALVLDACRWSAVAGTGIDFQIFNSPVSESLDVEVLVSLRSDACCEPPDRCKLLRSGSWLFQDGSGELARNCIR